MNLQLVFRILVEVLYGVYQHPEELPGYLATLPRLKGYVVGVAALASLSVATGLYYLRDFYDVLFWIQIPAVWIVMLLFFLSGGVLLGTLMDAWVTRDRQDRPNHAWLAVSLTMLSLAPYLFFTPIAILARLIASPLLLMLPMTLALAAWSFQIQMQGVRYLYELTIRDALKLLLQSLMIFLLFPGLLVLVVVSLAGISG